MIKNKLAILFIFILALAVTSAIVFDNAPEIISEERLNQYSWTTAMCNSSGSCFDAYVVCTGNATLSITPVTGLISFGEDWKDTRENKSLCPT